MDVIWENAPMNEMVINALYELGRNPQLLSDFTKRKVNWSDSLLLSNEVKNILEECDLDKLKNSMDFDGLPIPTLHLTVFHWSN